MVTMLKSLNINKNVNYITGNVETEDDAPVREFAEGVKPAQQVVCLAWAKTLTYKGSMHVTVSLCMEAADVGVVQRVCAENYTRMAM